MVITYSDVWDTIYGASFSAGSDGNLAEDPLFVSWSSGADWTSQDLHLRSVADGHSSNSPCINTGDRTDRDVDGTRADMGYYGGSSAPP